MYLDAIRGPFEGIEKATLSPGSAADALEGGWEAVKEAVDVAIHALRQVRRPLGPPWGLASTQGGTSRSSPGLRASSAMGCRRDGGLTRESAEGGERCGPSPAHVQVWPIKLPSGKFAMSQRRVENFLHVTAVAVAAYIQVSSWSACLHARSIHASSPLARLRRSTASWRPTPPAPPDPNIGCCCAPQSQLRGGDLWLLPYSELRGALVGASQAVARMASESLALSQDWALGLDSGGHDWQGASYCSPLLLALLSRLEEVRRGRGGKGITAGTLSSTSARLAGGLGGRPCKRCSVGAWRQCGDTQFSYCVSCVLRVLRRSTTCARRTTSCRTCWAATRRRLWAATRSLRPSSTSTPCRRVCQALPSHCFAQPGPSC